MIITTICLNYGTKEDTKQFVENALSISLINYIVVVDNNSPDDSFLFLQSLYETNPRVYVIKSESNIGFAGGNNIGADFAIRNLSSDILIISNPDVSFSADLVQQAVFRFENDDMCGLLSFDCASSETNSSVSSARYFPKTIFNYFFRKNNNVHPNCSIEKCDYAAGALSFVRATAFKNAGYYDSNTFLYCEEIILGERLRSAGYSCFIDHTKTYFHSESSSIGKYNGYINKHKLLIRSMKYYWLSYRSNSFFTKFKIFLYSCLLMFLATVKFAIKSLVKK